MPKREDEGTAWESDDGPTTYASTTKWQMQRPMPRWKPKQAVNYNIQPTEHTMRVSHGISDLTLPTGKVITLLDLQSSRKPPCGGYRTLKEQFSGTQFIEDYPQCSKMDRFSTSKLHFIRAFGSYGNKRTPLSIAVRALVRSFHLSQFMSRASIRVLQTRHTKCVRVSWANCKQPPLNPNGVLCGRHRTNR
jgi:hypothetical protein